MNFLQTAAVDFRYSEMRSALAFSLTFLLRDLKVIVTSHLSCLLKFLKKFCLSFLHSMSLECRAVFLHLLIVTGVKCFETL